VALQLAMSDERDLPILEKLADAKAFLRSRVQ
jgi:hypothetical protein